MQVLFLKTDKTKDVKGQEYCFLPTFGLVFSLERREN